MTAGWQDQYRCQAALYIHLPFCHRKCHYCDFVSYPGQRVEVMKAYCQAVMGEMELLGEQYRPGPLATVFLGGGTPTVLPAGDLGGLLQKAFSIFGRQPQAEISLEANPGTVDIDKYRFLLAAGANRLSLGVQSFDDRLLEGMGRIHRRGEIYRSYNLARKAGFSNINLDLIFGLPGQTRAQWKATIKEALSLQPEHIAAYSLQLETGTLWGELQAGGSLTLPDEELTLAMYQEIREQLSLAGYEHYEISNFARRGYQCRHNLYYWLNRPYLGVGAAAASFWQGRRWQNYSSLEQYSTALAAGKLPVAESETLTLRLQMAETMFMGMRLMAGINLAAFQMRFGLDALTVYASELDWLLSRKLVEIQAGHLKLTERGLPLANEVFIQFL